MVKECIWKQTMKWQEEPVLELSLRRPELVDSARRDKRVSRYYARLAQLWRARWERVVYPRACQALAEARENSRPFQPWSASLDYRVTLEDGTLLSLYLDAVERGVGRPVTVRSADTWNRATGTPLPLSAFLPRPLRGRRRLLGELQALAEERLQAGESLFFQDVAQRVQSHFSPQRFYLTPEELVLFFPMLSLGSAAEGIPTFSFPRAIPSPENCPEKSTKIL